MQWNTSLLDEIENSEIDQNKERSYMQNELLEMIGFMSEEGAFGQFGLSPEEYNNPTEETLDKVRKILIERGSSNISINEYGEIIRNSSHK